MTLKISASEIPANGIAANAGQYGLEGILTCPETYAFPGENFSKDIFDHDSDLMGGVENRYLADLQCRFVDGAQYCVTGSPCAFVFTTRLKVIQEKYDNVAPTTQFLSFCARKMLNK
jgi:hypothetical protein